MNGKCQKEIKDVFFEDVHCDEGDSQLQITQLNIAGSVLFEFLSVKEFIKFKMISKTVKTLIDQPIKTAGDHIVIDKNNYNKNKIQNSSQHRLTELIKQEAFHIICPHYISL